MDDHRRSRTKKAMLAGLALILGLLSACGPRGTPQPEVCETHTASLTLSALETTVAVGDQVTVTATLSNQGCGMLGLPIYRLRVDAEDGLPGLELIDPEPVSHSLGIDPGEVDQAEFALRAVSPGVVRLGASVSYEVHLDSSSGAYWGASDTAESLVITVVP